MKRALFHVAKTANILVLLGFFAGCGEQSMTVDTEATEQKTAARPANGSSSQNAKKADAAAQARGMRHSTDDTELAVAPATSATPAKRAALTSEERLAACEDYDYLSPGEQAELESVCSTQP